MQLITGGLGFIGKHTARAFIEAGEKVVLTANRNRNVPAFLEGEVDKNLFVESVDLTNPHGVIEVLQKHEATGIVHLAAPPVGVLSPSDDYRINMNSLINILEGAHILDIKRVSIASSSTPYLDLPTGPFTEDMPLLLKSGGSTPAYKKAYEAIAGHFSDRTGVEVVFPRPGGVYGPGYTSMVNVHSRLVHAAVKGVPGPLKGRIPNPHAEDPVQCCYVRDCARAIQMLQMAPELKHREYNITIGHLVTATDIAEAVKNVVPDFEYKLEPGKGPRYIPDAYLDITRIRQGLGFEPGYTLEETIADYIGWLRAGNDN